VDSNAAFLRRFEGDAALWTERTLALQSLLTRVLDDSNYDLAQIAVRAKSPKSVMTKLLFKQYDDPATQMTDLLGARVITFYGEQVDRIVARLRSALTIDERNSLDKRQELLEKSQFGYRSVHLVGRLNRRSLAGGEFRVLRGVTFEVQIRSVLDHAWAEIEHELVYKAEIDYPAETNRRFRAVAGAFEILELEFLRLKAESARLIDTHRDEYDGGREGSVALDGARLVAICESLQPDGLGWRHSTSVGQSPEFDVRRCLKAFRQVGLVTGSKVRQAFKSSKLQRMVETYASVRGVAPGEVSHFALVVMLVATNDASVAAGYFPELSRAEGLAIALGIESEAVQ
jgi:ppGpp synthetase/RelA/SpoT-type nucleotidyltranferase